MSYLEHLPPLHSGCQSSIPVKPDPAHPRIPFRLYLTSYKYNYWNNYPIRYYISGSLIPWNGTSSSLLHPLPAPAYPGIVPLPLSIPAPQGVPARPLAASSLLTALREFHSQGQPLALVPAPPARCPFWPLLLFLPLFGLAQSLPPICRPLALGSMRPLPGLLPQPRALPQLPAGLIGQMLL